MTSRSHLAPVVRCGIATVLMTAACVMALAGAKAREHDEHRERAAIQRAVERGELIPLPKILRLAQKRVAGEIIEVEIDQAKSGISYEIKILTAKGRVREVKLDARSGRLIEIDDD